MPQARVRMQPEPGLPALPSPPCLPPSSWPAWLSLFCFAISHPFSSPSTFSFWFLPPLPVAVSHLCPFPHLRRGRAKRGTLSPAPPPHAGPQCGALCLLLGLCEPVCARVHVSTCPGAAIYPPWIWRPWGQDLLWPPQTLCTSPCTSWLGAEEVPMRGIAAGSWRSTLITGDLISPACIEVCA